MALKALWNPNIQFLKTDGTINAGGKLVVTDHNEADSVPANYSDADGTTLNASPIVLDALGRATCYIDDGSTYDLYVKDANGATLWTVTEMTPGSETIVVRAGFSVSSNDSSVSVVISVDQNGVTNYDLSIQKEIDRATEAEKASRTEIVAGDNITVEKTVGADGQDVYTVSGERGDNLVDDVRVNGASVVTDKVANIDVPVAGTASPLMDGNASVGNSLKYAREDHVHPSDTSREDIANKTTVVLGTSDSKYPTDKAVAEFVNSSIATNTANYISNNGEPFTSVAQLEAYSGTVTNNDYAFVTGIDSEGNTYYDRYKATVSGSTVTWALEYRLNNSSFTAAQWSAINSGITSALVAKIHTHSNKDVLDGITSTDVANWNSKMDRQSVGNVSEPVYIENGIAKVATNVATNSNLNSKLNVDGKNATTEGVTAMMKKVESGSVDLTDDSYYFGDGRNDHTKIVRRPILNIWNYIAGKVQRQLLGSVGSSDKPIYLENGVPKVCADGVPYSEVSSGGNVGYGVFVGGANNIANNTRCYCTFLVSVASSPYQIAHTYIGTFTFRGKTLKSELSCLTGIPAYPLRIVVVSNVAGKDSNGNPTYNVGLYVIPADKTYISSKYTLTRIASASDFIWDVKALNSATYDELNSAAKPALRPIILRWDANASNVTTTGGTWIPTFDKATIIDCRGIVDMSIQVELSIIGQTTYIDDFSSYEITLVNSSKTDILPESLHQKCRMPRATRSTTGGGTIDTSCTHRFIFPITSKSNFLAGYRPKITLPSKYVLDSGAQVNISALCRGIVLPYGADEPF